MTTQVPALSAMIFGHASHSSVRRSGRRPAHSRRRRFAGGSASSSVAGISATPMSDNSVSRPDRCRAGCFLAPIEAGSMCTGRKGGLRECSAGESLDSSHDQLVSVKLFNFHREFHGKRCEHRRVFRIVWRRGRSKHARTNLLAIWIGALALPSPPATSRRRHCRTDFRSFADLAGSAKVLVTDRQCRHRCRLACRQQAHRRERAWR